MKHYGNRSVGISVDPEPYEIKEVKVIKCPWPKVTCLPSLNIFKGLLN